MTATSLIGVPSVGATSTGRHLPLMTGVRHQDLGALIEEGPGMSMPIFTRQCSNPKEKSERCRPTLGRFIERHRDDDHIMDLTPVEPEGQHDARPEEGRGGGGDHWPLLKHNEKGFFYYNRRKAVRKRLNDGLEGLLVEDVMLDTECFRRSRSRGSLHVDIGGRRKEGPPA